VKQTNIPNGLLVRLVANIPLKENRVGFIFETDSPSLPPKRKSRRQHQADKGGFPIIESFPGVRIPSFVPSKKLHDYRFFILLLSGKVKGGIQRMNYEG